MLSSSNFVTKTNTREFKEHVPRLEERRKRSITGPKWETTYITRDETFRSLSWAGLQHILVLFSATKSSKTTETDRTTTRTLGGDRRGNGAASRIIAARFHFRHLKFKARAANTDVTYFATCTFQTGTSRKSRVCPKTGHGSRSEFLPVRFRFSGTVSRASKRRPRIPPKTSKSAALGSIVRAQT